MIVTRLNLRPVVYYGELGFKKTNTKIQLDFNLTKEYNDQLNEAVRRIKTEKGIERFEKKLFTAAIERIYFFERGVALGLYKSLKLSQSEIFILNNFNFFYFGDDWLMETKFNGNHSWTVTGIGTYLLEK